MTVKDTVAPALQVPANVTLEATGGAGASYAIVTSSFDIVDPNPEVTCAPASGVFPISDTVVSCTAVDDAGNRTVRSFTVTVRDTTAPLAACTPSVNPSTIAIPRASRQNEDGFYLISGSDAGAMPVTITLGSYRLRNGETVKFTQSPGTKGVVFLNTMGSAAIRHFLVGPGDPTIAVIDAAGNRTTQVCYVPRPPK